MTNVEMLLTGSIIINFLLLLLVLFLSAKIGSEPDDWNFVEDHPITKGYNKIIVTDGKVVDYSCYVSLQHPGKHIFGWKDAQVIAWRELPAPPKRRAK